MQLQTRVLFSHKLPVTANFQEKISYKKILKIAVDSHICNRIYTFWRRKTGEPKDKTGFKILLSKLYIEVSK